MGTNLSEWLSKLAASDYFIGAAALLFLLFLCKIFFRKNWISISGSKFGKVRMSRRALYSVIYGVTSDIEGIIGRHAKVVIKCGKVYIDIYIKLGVCRNISAISEDVQVRLNNILANDFGLNNISKINVVIAGFSRKSYRNAEFLAENCCEHHETKGDEHATDETG
ncbi:MAG: hypothetical protein LBF25_02335 [Puniceicoccales bacterium]|jgi:uncharacterized alkaline shock family protein YloU|nr:hypothetical protein [Puniceicoccales bacterium]